MDMDRFGRWRAKKYLDADYTDEHGLVWALAREEIY